MKIHPITTLCAVWLWLVSLPALAQSQPYEAVRALAQRRVPWLAKSLTFKRIAPVENKHDVFELVVRNGQLQIGASSPSAAAQGLGWYLKYYCNRSMSHMGDNLAPVSPLPAISQPIRITSPYALRYAYNYCTINYSLGFYRWPDWERELDWMALSGANLSLAIVGTEAIWQNTLKKLGYSDQEIGAFIASSAFSGWWLMGNLEGWGGPVSQALIDQQTQLQQQILKRMKALGIQPVMHGFYGMVPTTLAAKLPAAIVDQGNWAGDFKRPAFLVPTDPAFAKIADIYYAEMKKLYGNDLRYFAGDPFHEGGKTAGVDVAAAATAIQQRMQRHYPNSTWLLQGWQNNPSEQMLQNLDRNKTIVVELSGENTRNWERRKGFAATPFIWANVSNFGDKTGIYGKLQRIANEVDRARNSPYRQLLRGIGIVPEGIFNNPVVYNLTLELGWYNQPVDVSQWLKRYQQYRYGKTNAALEKAGQLLLETAYRSHDTYQEGAPESIFCARPDRNIKTVSSWGIRKRGYDLAKFEEAVRLLVSVADQFTTSETYQVDKLDLVRQVLANRADKVYEEMVNALAAKDERGFQTSAMTFQRMIMQQDSLLRNPHFSLHRWLRQAVDFADSPADKALSLKNAKAQISYWGPDTNPNTNLHDYAHKEWSGLLRSLYLLRWQKFTDDQLAKLKNPNAPSVDYYALETEWATRPDLYEQTELPQPQLDHLIATLLAERSAMGEQK